MRNSRTVRGCRLPFATKALAVTATMLAGCLLAAAQPKAAPKKAAAAKPMAMIISFGYPKSPLGELPNVVDNAEALAVQLQNAGYIVKVITDKKEGLKLPKLTEIVSDSAELEKKVHAWIDEVAKNPPPLAVLVASGHGVERSKEPYFLTPNETKAQGGVALNEIIRKAKEAAQNQNRIVGLPLVVVWNACRESADAAPPVKPQEKPVAQEFHPFPAKTGDFQWMTERIRGFHLVKKPPTQGEARGPTIFFSSQSGKTVDAEKDVVKYLGDLLRDKKQLDDFFRLFRRENNLTRLTVGDWFEFAKDLMQFRNRNFMQPHDVIVDAVIGETVMFSWTNDGKCHGAAHGPMIDLLDEDLSRVGQNANNCKAEFHARTGLAITANGKNENGRWAILPLTQPVTIDPVREPSRTLGMTLYMDVVAEGRNPKPTDLLYFSPNPFKSGKPNINFFPGNIIASNQDTSPVGISYNSPKRIAIALAAPAAQAQADQMNQIVWSNTAYAIQSLQQCAWPDEHVLRVIGLKVELHPPVKCPEKTDSPRIQVLTVDLLPVWRWTDGFPGADACQVQPARAEGKAVYRLVPTESADKKPALTRCGGLLYPWKYVPENSKLVIDARTKGGKKQDIIIDLLYEDPTDGSIFPYLESRRVTLPLQGEDKNGISIPSGFVNYLSISTQGAEVEIGSISVSQAKRK